MAQVVERVIGSDEVGGSTPPSSMKSLEVYLRAFFIIGTNLAFLKGKVSQLLQMGYFAIKI